MVDVVVRGMGVSFIDACIPYDWIVTKPAAVCIRWALTSSAFGARRWFALPSIGDGSNGH
jgi:hypothetical protein